MRGLGAVVFKELLQMRRDPVSLVLALMIPVIQLTIFGYAIDTEVRDVPVIVLDRARVQASRELVAALEATGTFRVREHTLDRDYALTRLRSGRAKVAVLIPPDFEQRLLKGEHAPVQVLVDGSDSNLAMQSQAAAQGAIRAWSERRAAPGASPFQPVAEARVRLLYNPDGRSDNFFVPGLAGIILQLVTMTLTASAIVRERERGTLEQLMVTPVSRFAVTFGKILPPILVAGAAATLVLVAMVHVFGVPIRGSLPLLIALLTLFVFTSLSLGLLISTVARTQLQSLMLTLLLLLPSILLSGFVFPRDTIPSPIWEVTWLIPATYFIEILRGVILRGATAPDLWHMIWPLAVIGIVVCGVVALRFRKTAA